MRSAILLIRRDNSAESRGFLFPSLRGPAENPFSKGGPHSRIALVVTELSTAPEKHALRLFSIYKLLYSITTAHYCRSDFDKRDLGVSAMRLEKLR